jgi:hypothetical protein
MVCGSKEFELPFSRFPLQGKAGAGGFPYTAGLQREMHFTLQTETFHFSTVLAQSGGPLQLMKIAAIQG